MRVFLLGFMGAGKSYWGSRLANLLRVPFIDTDRVIERRVALKVSDIFQTYGEGYFREQERVLLKEYLPPKPSFICATGGGMPLIAENMVNMHELGTTVFLDCSLAVLYARIRNSRATRPLLRQVVELESYIRAELTYRYPYYRQAKHILCANELKIQQFMPIIYPN